VINLLAFCDYFGHYVMSSFFGGRLNKVKEEFEEFLERLSQHARLIFVFKKIMDIGVSEKKWLHDKSENYKEQSKLAKSISRQPRTFDLWKQLSHGSNHEMNPLLQVVLAQSAKKFGEFRGNDIMVIRTTAGHIEIANEESAYAVIGLDTSYLLLEGTWKFYFPSHPKHVTHDAKNMQLTEYNKTAIMKHIGLNYNQMQLAAVLLGKTLALPRNLCTVMKRFFTNIDSSQAKVENAFKFAKQQQFPLTSLDFEKIVMVVFHTDDAKIVEELEFSVSAFRPICFTSADVFLGDDDSKEIIQDDPLMMLAERILYNQKLSLDYYFLDVNATDMKPLKELTLPWIKRLMGVLLKNVDGSKARPFYSYVGGREYDFIEVEAEIPQFEVPSLRDLLANQFGEEEKLRILSFLIGDLISLADLKNIPSDYLMNVIILVHLVEVSCIQLT